jgi:hypothetical protein
MHHGLDTFKSKRSSLLCKMTLYDDGVTTPQNKMTTVVSPTLRMSTDLGL